MAGMFSYYQRFRVVDRRYTELARTVALREAEVVNRERGLRPAVNETFPLEEATAAIGHMEEGTGIGKIVLDVPA